MKTVIVLNYSRFHRRQGELDSLVEHCQARHKVRIVVSDKERDSVTVGYRRFQID